MRITTPTGAEVIVAFHYRTYSKGGTEFENGKRILIIGE